MHKVCYVSSDSSPYFSIDICAEVMTSQYLLWSDDVMPHVRLNNTHDSSARYDESLCCCHDTNMCNADNITSTNHISLEAI